jgi:hypothetical protein
VAAYETYLYDVSGLDDNLNQTWVPPLSQVATISLAQATVRAAAAILRAHEHGVGQLRDDHLGLTLHGPTSASITDCQDEKDFYLVSDGSGEPDPAITRADFVGTAELTVQAGHWLVAVFTTTHTECNY